MVDTAFPSRRIVLGLGNPDRGDDAAGRAVVRRLRGTVPGDWEIAELGGEATDLLALFDGAASAVLVDACVSGVAAGTVRRFDAVRDTLPAAAFGVSSHGFGLAEAIELARTLGQLPRTCVIYAIEGACFDAGAPLSPPVAAAIETLAARLARDLQNLETPHA